MKQLLLSLAILTSLTGCKEGWTNEYKQQYLQVCQDSPNARGLYKQQRDAYCQCSLEEVMKHYDNIEEVVANKDSTAVNAAMRGCREEALR